MKLTSEILEELAAEWKITSGEMCVGVHLSTGKVIEAKSASSLAKMLQSWSRDLYMVVC
jgi:hypothetical protein